MKKSNYILFGGAGFIGAHYCRYLLENDRIGRIIIADLVDACDERFEPFLQQFIREGRIVFKACDVRLNIREQIASINDVVGIANFASIHREPGHEPYEYYETNLLGAENVCNYAEDVDCRQLIFTSSIAPYGPTETPKSEQSLPVPLTPYGGSKLAAEKIHEVWASKSNDRSLTIVRPGVVFGPGEGGNVTRMIRAIRGGYFVFVGNKATRKAGIYVKELCKAIWWGVNLEKRRQILLMNLTMSPGPSVEEYVQSVVAATGWQRWIPNIPYFVIYPLSVLIEIILKPIGVNHPISPVRIKKLVQSNNIVPNTLIQNGYHWEYDLYSAMVDWFQDYPVDWGGN